MGIDDIEVINKEAMIEGVKVYDPRIDEYILSTNPALIMLDLVFRKIICIGGLDCDNLISFIMNMADYCEREVKYENN